MVVKMLKRLKMWWDYDGRDLLLVVIIFGGLGLMLFFFFYMFFSSHVVKNPNKYYDYSTTEVEHYTKYDANGTTTVELQEKNGKKLIIEDVKFERHTGLPDKKHKLGSTAVTLQEPKVKKKFPGIVRFILKPAIVNSDSSDDGIKPTLVITKYKYDD